MTRRLELWLRGTCAVVGFSVVAGYLLARPVEAATRRLPPASICHPVTGYETKAGYDTAGILRNTTSNQYAAITCGIPSDTTITHTSATTLQIHGRNPRSTSPFPWFAACVHDWDILALSCGTSTSVGFGTFNVQPSRSVWNNAAYADNYPYLDVNTFGQEQIYGVLVGN